MKLITIKKKESYIKVASVREVILEGTIEHFLIALFSVVQFLMRNGINEVNIKQNVDAACRAFNKIQKIEKSVKN